MCIKGSSVKESTEVKRVSVPKGQGKRVPYPIFD